MTTHSSIKPHFSSAPHDLPRLPHPLELTVLFREFIQYWTGFHTRIFEPNSLPNPAEPIEYTTGWNGSVKGTLVLRSSHRFLEKLINFFQENGMNFPMETGLFQEMITLYCIFLLHYAWMDELFELGPILARPSRPTLWPSVKPRVYCTVEVEGEPVEVRLWLDDSRKPIKKNQAGGVG